MIYIGFIPGRNTMDAIVQVIQDWSKAKDMNKNVLSVFFDFSKAFDLVDHELLLIKLQQYLPPWLISWIATYLQDRKQRVILGNTQTEWKKVEAGVIQGSVLGPILFVLFIADINNYLPASAQLLKYADDILAYIIGNTTSSTLPQDIVNAVAKRCSINKMKLNTTKCKIMSITPNHQSLAPIYLNNTPLEQVNMYKYLGIEINDQLNWEDQWYRVQKQTISIPFLIKTMRRLGFNEKTMVNTYRSLALSHIIYSAPLLSHSNVKVKSEMTSFHNRILRIINITQEQATIRHNIKTIDQLIDTTNISIIKRITADDTHPLTQKLRLKRLRTTRQNFSYKIDKARTTAYANCFTQKYLRVLRDGAANIYTTQTSTRAASTKPTKPLTQQKTTKPKITCTKCNREYAAGAGIALHSRKCQAPKTQTLYEIIIT